MSVFILDERLERDCHRLGILRGSHLLLMDNALVPWLILVPETEETELYRLPREVQIQLLEGIDDLSRFLEARFTVDKLNVAAIGNVVRQMHIHIVARRKDDFCWPGVVWGSESKQAYEALAVDALRSALEGAMAGRFRPYT